LYSLNVYVMYTYVNGTHNVQYERMKYRRVTAYNDMACQLRVIHSSCGGVLY